MRNGFVRYSRKEKIHTGAQKGYCLGGGKMESSEELIQEDPLEEMNAILLKFPSENVMYNAHHSVSPLLWNPLP